MNKNSIILLVEDNPDDEALAIRALRHNNVANTIHVAQNGAEALEYLFNPELEELPSVVLLDLKLPKVDGLEVLRQVRANESTRLLPVVILTSSSEENDIIDSYHLGANSYVRKPVDFQQFTEAVRQLGLYWLLVNEQPPRRRK